MDDGYMDLGIHFVSNGTCDLTRCYFGSCTVLLRVWVYLDLCYEYIIGTGLYGIRTWGDVRSSPS